MGETLTTFRTTITATYRSAIEAMRGARRHPRYFRPAEVELLLGVPSKARREFGLEPKVKFRELVEMMVDSDFAGQEREKYLQDGGYSVKNYFE